MTYLSQFRFALPLVAALAAPALAQEQASTTPPTADTVVATVGDHDITLGHMLVVRARLPQQYDELDDETLFQGILDQLVQQTVLAQNAGDLSQANLLILQNEERALLSSQVVADKAREATTDDAIQAAYDEQYASAGGETEWNASHILVETEDEAKALVEELNGGAEFAALAREKSTGPSGPNGGLLGWFGKGMMVPAFEEAVMGLEAGQISAPVQTQFGWHVVVLNDMRQTEAPSIDEVRDQIVDGIQREAVDAYIAELEAGTEITRPEDGAFDPTVLRDLSLIGEE